MILSVDWGSVSSALGVASLFTWLFAQSPQVYLNFKSGSVEGLALPFLVSWFLGDFTNLLGCVLTHQLPFQTWLASYFIVVDIVLCGQFAYYSRIRPVPHFPPLSEDFPYAQPSPHASFIHPRRSTSRKGRGRSSRTRLLQSSGAEDEEAPMVASWMTESSTASTATSPHQPTRPLPSRTSTGGSSAATSVPPSPTFPERGRTLQRSAIRTFDPTLVTIEGSPSSRAGFVPSNSAHPAHPAHPAHHVAFSREPYEGASFPVQAPAHERQRTSSSRSRPPPPSRRSTSVVFLSVGALFTLGKLGGAAMGSMDVAEGGRAWSALQQPVEAASWRIGNVRHPALFPTTATAPLDVAPASRVRRSAFPLDVSAPSTSTAQHDDDEELPPPPPPQFDWERVVGRTSAWVCTTAYLTSRLPQIWQNFRRRSVEGLAMTLFAAAFLGNSLYVASILTNPLASSPGYLLESTPYLIGSGGTLCFDLMILGQSWLYSERRRARRDRERRRRSAHGFDPEEEAALLDADGEDGEAAKHRHLAHGDRSRSTSTLGYGRSVSTSASGRRTLSVTGGGGPHRSTSTELLPGAPRHARFLAAARDPFADDDPFDFDAYGGGTGDTSRSASRGPSIRVPSRHASFEVTIVEEGESSVTLQPADEE